MSLSKNSVGLRNQRPGDRLVVKRICIVFTTFLALGLVGCSHKEKTSGQSLARVDGEEITVLQLNEELSLGKVVPEKRDAASKELLQELINRQLFENEATKEKLDRDPAVSQAIERAKSMIIAQAYLQKRLAKVAAPTHEEIEKYFNDHPDIFADRKLFQFDQVLVTKKNITDEMKTLISSGKTLDDIVAWLKNNHIEYVQNVATNSSADLSPAFVTRLKQLHKAQVFALQEGDRIVIASVKSVKDTPVKIDAVESQIAGLLTNQRDKEAVDNEVKRLRASAKIEILNKKLADATPAVNAAPANDKADSNTKKDSQADSVKKGMADL